MEFHFRAPGGDRRHYVDEKDVKVVLARLPPDTIARVRAIHFTDHAKGNRRLGYVPTRGRREISLCALPPHVSLNRFLSGPQTALMFGAVEAAQWPSLAVRRFMLYDVLLHEVGHLQVVDEGARSARRKFAHETVAQDLANRWREELWSTRIDHADPVHNPPTAEETAALSRWAEAHSEYRRGLTAQGEVAQRHFERALELYPAHSLALTELASCVTRQAIITRADLNAARGRAVELLCRALCIDPTFFDANVQMGWNCGHLGRYEDARRHFARAIRYKAMSAKALSAWGDAHADWGFLVEAERLFEKALALEPDDPAILRNHARAVWDLGAHTTKETSRALALFTRALAADPNDVRSHRYLARALATIPGEAARALHHAARALALRPEDAAVAELVARLREPLQVDELAHFERKVILTRTFDRRTGDVVEHV
jgi:tetratricopeptide (TPR) repeat protein